MWGGVSILVIFFLLNVPSNQMCSTCSKKAGFFSSQVCKAEGKGVTPYHSRLYPFLPPLTHSQPPTVTDLAHLERSHGRLQNRQPRKKMWWYFYPFCYKFSMKTCISGECIHCVSRSYSFVSTLIRLQHLRKDGRTPESRENQRENRARSRISAKLTGWESARSHVLYKKGLNGPPPYLWGGGGGLFVLYAAQAVFPLKISDFEFSGDCLSGTTFQEDMVQVWLYF